MLKKISIAAAIVFSICAFAIFAFAQKTPQAKDNFPEIELLKPADKTHLKYLGLSGSGTFTINQIKAQAVIVQIFSMYCPYCQADAPNVNRLYGLIEGNFRLKDKIKILGIGAGNTSFEVNTFKKRYKVEFPLIPDGDFKIHKILGEVRTPYFIVVTLKSSKKPQIIYSRLGAHDDIDAFLEEIVTLAGIK
ncbi:MAG TPA: TlpA family protein disulfide reductase [Deltaproteobacteria bacterium]|nr:TlpA family protein disulfide reductase [Deltaproteobacteria bacterium]